MVYLWESPSHFVFYYAIFEHYNNFPGLLQYFTAFVLGYFIGSIPISYLLVKSAKQIDLRKVGSNNVGAMNAFEVTGSGLIGVLAMIGDLLKGIIAVVLMLIVWGTDHQVVAGIAGISAIVGHNYPVWLKFKGGRGLSTTAGVMLVMCWLFVVTWCAIWGIFYKITNDLHKANIIASVAGPLLLVLIPQSVISVTLPPFINPEIAIIFSCISCILILIRHEDQIRLMIRSHR